ncbi:1-acyl-sn-glycerol-3-phosphate acyltransferase [Candidatus Symbiothrix dinenymphae]|nr:1-acyl-sn-glycerol-3-phosphate acyltransferase [Candidatus Symbiothrix dinenymphae]
MKKGFFALYELFIWLPINVALTGLTSLVTIVGCSLGGERYFSYYPSKYWSRIVCWITFCPVKVFGREHLDKKQSYIFVANHQSAFDIWLIFAYLGVPIRWMMKKSLRKMFFVGKACESAGYIFVDTASPKTIEKTMRNAKEKLQNGNSVVIFPEGSRTPDGTMQKFKKGAFQMAIDLQLPIVPLTINGAYRVMSKNTVRIQPHPMTLTIHPPIPPQPIDKNDRREVVNRLQTLSEQSRKAIASALV